MDLKINDVAELLNVSETTIRSWVNEGKIPAYRINQQYRFNRTEIEDWLIHNKQAKTDKLEDPDLTLPTTGPGANHFGLYRSIHKGNVFTDIPGNTKEEIIRNTMKRIADDLNLDAEVLTDLLLDRENLQATALNNGIGIPHTRDFLLSEHHNAVIVVYPKQPIEYGAMDNKPVHTLFFLFACDDKKHLHLLAKIAHLSSQPAALKYLQTRPNKEGLLAYIKDWEANRNSS